LSVKLFSNLVNKLSESETKQLFSNPVNVEKLLKLVENSINESNRDTNLIEEILSVFVTITDLSPNVCEIFVEKGGIDLCFDILNVSLT
jgi:dimeric dUTPase (all-alpha-NTP-PPase superfamily)